jgi:hypothetical protein
MGVDIAQEILRDLSQKRQNLLLELKNYEENMKVGCVCCFVFTFMPFAAIFFVKTSKEFDSFQIVVADVIPLELFSGWFTLFCDHAL